MEHCHIKSIKVKLPNGFVYKVLCKIMTADMCVFWIVQICNDKQDVTLLRLWRKKHDTFMKH